MENYIQPALFLANAVLQIGLFTWILFVLYRFFHGQAWQLFSKGSAAHPAIWQFVFDIFSAILLIALLASLATSAYQQAIDRSKLLQGIALAHGLRNHAQVHYALTGHWPSELTDQDLFFTGNQQQDGQLQAHFSNQAIQLDVPAFAPGHKTPQQLTIHPATPTADALGPIILVAGPQSRPGWQSHGEDQTTIATERLSPLWR